MAFIGPPYLGLLRERAGVVEQILRMGAEAADQNDWSLAIIDARSDLLEGYWKRFQDAQRRLMLEFPHAEIVMEEYNAAEQAGVLAYTTAKAALNQLKEVRLAAAPRPPKLPKASDIRLSKFSGLYTDWAGWRAEYQAKVCCADRCMQPLYSRNSWYIGYKQIEYHTNQVLDTQLDASDKITLLLSALTKEAAHCAGRAERLDQLELDRIWSKLEKTYDNKYQQVQWQHHVLMAILSNR